MVPRFQDFQGQSRNLGIPRKFQDSKIDPKNHGILELSGKFQDSMIFRPNLGRLQD